MSVDFWISSDLQGAVGGGGRERKSPFAHTSFICPFGSEEYWEVMGGLGGGGGGLQEMVFHHCLVAACTVTTTTLLRID